MKKLFRSYGALAVAAVFFLVLGVAVDPADRTQRTVAGTAVAGVPIPTGPTVTLEDGTVVTDPNNPGGTDAGGGGGGGGGGGESVGGVQQCTDRSAQIPGDPYSPPCYTFSGDNGGATAQGVTATEIVISARELEGPTAAEIFADISGQAVNDSPEAVKDTALALAEYFSTHFQFYGRTLRFEFFKGEGVGASELLGGGREQALADAIHASQQIGAFADITALTIPYADALSRNGVVNIGAPYPSSQWFTARRPYAWSLFPDGTNVVIAASSWIISRLSGQPEAVYAGPSLRGRPRKYALVAPENAEYQESVNAYIGELAKGGLSVSMNLKYKLDISSMPNQASNIIAQLKDAGITTVLCGCDPVMLALGLTPKANEQGYEPEWVTAGLAFVEQDIVAQLIDEAQWSRAFGIAYNAESEPQGRSFPYAAYKTMRPNDEPAFGVEEIYYQMYMLALGIQMAGPNLTPETFEAGMFAYPGGAGPRGYWRFGENDYTPMDDFREIWWDPTRISTQNNQPGAWVQLFGGARYFPGQVPAEPAPYFEDG